MCRSDMTQLDSSLCNLCVLCVSVVNNPKRKTHHRDTENTEVAQRYLNRDSTPDSLTLVLNGTTFSEQFSNVKVPLKICLLVCVGVRTPSL